MHCRHGESNRQLTLFHFRKDLFHILPAVFDHDTMIQKKTHERQNSRTVPNGS